jgi:hypothetical protein
MGVHIARRSHRRPAQGGDLGNLFQATVPAEEEALDGVALVGIVMAVVDHNGLGGRGQVEQRRA